MEMFPNIFQIWRSHIFHCTGCAPPSLELTTELMWTNPLSIPIRAGPVSVDRNFKHSITIYTIKREGERLQFKQISKYRYDIAVWIHSVYRAKQSSVTNTESVSWQNRFRIRMTAQSGFEPPKSLTKNQTNMDKFSFASLYICSWLIIAGFLSWFWDFLSIPYCFTWAPKMCPSQILPIFSLLSLGCQLSTLTLPWLCLLLLQLLQLSYESVLASPSPLLKFI